MGIAVASFGQKKKKSNLYLKETQTKNKASY